MQKLKSSQIQKNDGVVLEVLPGQAWGHEEYHQPLYGTLGRGNSFFLTGPSPARGIVLPFAGMGSYEAGGGTMYEKHLKRVHLSRLSPVKWGWEQGYPRKQLGVPIKKAYQGMGEYGTATSINPKGSPVWSETWQQRAAGALHRVNPQAMNGCACSMGAEESSGTKKKSVWVILAGLGALALLAYRDYSVDRASG